MSTYFVQLFIKNMLTHTNSVTNHSIIKTTQHVPLFGVTFCFSSSFFASFILALWIMHWRDRSSTHFFLSVVVFKEVKVSCFASTQTVNIEARCQNTQFQCRLSWRCLIYSTLCIVCWSLTTNFIFKNDTLIKYVTGHALFELVLSLRYTITLTKTQLLFYLQNMSNATRLIFPTGSEYLCNLHKINSDRSR